MDAVKCVFENVKSYRERVTEVWNSLPGNLRLFFSFICPTYLSLFIILAPVASLPFVSGAMSDCHPGHRLSWLGWPFPGLCGWASPTMNGPRGCVFSLRQAFVFKWIWIWTKPTCYFDLVWENHVIIRRNCSSAPVTAKPAEDDE